jgi:hypothetical protein
MKMSISPSATAGMDTATAIANQVALSTAKKANQEATHTPPGCA